MLDLFKEAGRIILLGLLAWLLTDQVIARIVDLVTINFALDQTIKAQITIVLTTILKSIDRALHEADKGVFKETKGIVPF